MPGIPIIYKKVRKDVRTLAKLKETTIKKRRLKELHDIFATIPDDKARLVEPMIVMAANMEINIVKLEVELQATGFVEIYQNGENQTGTKESTVSRSYSTMVKNYNSIIRTLLDCLPKSEQKAAEDELSEFIRARDKNV